MKKEASDSAPTPTLGALLFVKNGLLDQSFSEGAIICGWKDIARYMGMAVRTVQRYEHYGLPIRRPTSKVKGFVIATKAELDAWIKAKPLTKSLSVQPKLLERRAASFELFKVAIDNHRRLRGEMTKVRNEVQTSVERLRLTLLASLSTISPALSTLEHSQATPVESQSVPSLTNQL